MNVQPWLWFATILVVVVMLAFDLFVVGRRPHEPSMRESSAWVIFYIGAAVAFGLVILALHGGGYAGEFYAGWLTEYSLSVDNLFVFVIIMSRFSVPAAYQQRVLTVGIVLALIMRGLFIALGAAVIARFSWVFYLFGAFLCYTAVHLAISGTDQNDNPGDNFVLRLVRRVLPTTPAYHGAALTTKIEGRRLFTPMLVVMVAIGTTDLLFALDSIPAIFGLTKEPFLVFAANAFALLGLRQLYFLIGGLLNRLVYLSYGLAIVLGFIGVKLVLEALHTNSLPFVNSGEPFEWAPEIPIWLSLLVILTTLAVTTALSLIKSGRDRRSSVLPPSDVPASRP
jgi:tellurite resistance protein TerC